MARFQYQGYVEPLKADEPTIESWGPVLPPLPVRRLISVAVMAATGAVFVPLPAPPDTTTVSGEMGGGATGRAAVRQYQAHAGPVLVPAAAETVTIDKWTPVAPSPRARVVVPQGFTVGPIVVPDVTTPAPALSWAPTYPDRPPGRQRPIELPTPVAPLVVPDVTNPAPALSWASVVPDRTTTRARSTPPLFIAQPIEPIAAAPADTTTVSGEMGGGIPPRAMGRQYLSLAGPVLVPSVGETITIDKWTPGYPASVVRRALGPLGYSIGPLVVPDVTVPVPPLAFVQTSQPARRRVDVNLVTWVEFTIVEDVPGVPTVVYPNRLPSRRPTPTSLLTEPIAPPAAAQAAPDPWTPIYPNQLVTRPRATGALTVAAPLYVPDVTVVVPPGSWAAVSQERLAARTRRPASVIVERLDPLVTVPDYWTPIYPDRVRGRSRLVRVESFVGPLVVPDVTVPVPPGSWAPVYPDRAPGRRRTLIGFMVDRLIVDPIVIAVTGDWMVLMPADDAVVVMPADDLTVVMPADDTTEKM